MYRCRSCGYRNYQIDGSYCKVRVFVTSMLAGLVVAIVLCW